MRTHRGIILGLLGLAIGLGGCAGGDHLRGTGTATDESADRILVTVPMNTLAGVADLSPSGRLDYLPPTPDEVRDAQRQRAQAIAETFALRLEEDWPIPALGVYCFVFRVGESDSTRRDRIIAALADHPDVESAQSLNFFHARSDPLVRTGDARDSTRLYDHASGKHVRIAVIDTGADLQHEDLASANITAFDMVGSGGFMPAEHHGTAVLGVIAAQRDNGKGIAGYAPDAKIALFRACWQPRPDNEHAVCNTFTLAKALSYALESDADIVNLSISGPRDPLLERLAAELASRNKLLVAAGDSRNTFPASATGSIVAADLFPDAAPVMTLLPDNRYGVRGGTSLQAASVSGIAAMIREIAPRIPVADLHQRLARLRGGTVDSAFADLLQPPVQDSSATNASAAN